jgi:hypothetical protein
MQLGFRSMDGKFIRTKIAGDVAGAVLARPEKGIMWICKGEIRSGPAECIGYIPICATQVLTPLPRCRISI